MRAAAPRWQPAPARSRGVPALDPDLGGVAIVAFFVILAIFAPLIAPYGFDQVTADGVRFPKQASPRRDASRSGPRCSRPTCSRG